MTDTYMKKIPGNTFLSEIQKIVPVNVQVKYQKQNCSD